MKNHKKFHFFGHPNYGMLFFAGKIKSTQVGFELETLRLETWRTITEPSSRCIFRDKKIFFLKVFKIRIGTEKFVYVIFAEYFWGNLFDEFGIEFSQFWTRMFHVFLIESTR
jgi:hypothetical protein